MASNYLDKHRFCEPHITDVVSSDAGISVVIPCCNEPALLTSLQALWDCERTAGVVEVLVVINAAEDATDDILVQNIQTAGDAREWIQLHNDEKLRYFIIENNDLPKKHAGVGLARKIGMDEAVARFNQIGNDKGVIVCFDADCSCDPNYLKAIESHFNNNPLTPACSIYYEHPLHGDEFSSEIYEGIINYELFLRYYRQGLKYAGFPYAYHTIGSSMAVRSNIYQQQGGMNKRQAGEDFYFLQKIIPLGNFTELNTTKVIPSPRPSLRVPFGTGKAISEWLQNEKEQLLAYHPQSFTDLKILFQQVLGLYALKRERATGEFICSLPASVSEWLKLNDFEKHLEEIRANSSSQEAFVKRFFNWFNAFMVLKYVHFSRDNHYPDVEVGKAATELLKQMGSKKGKASTNIQLLSFYRQLDRR